MTDDLKRFDKDGMRKAQRLREFSPSPILSFLWLSSVRFRFFSLSKLSAQTSLTNLARTRTSSTPALHVSAPLLFNLKHRHSSTLPPSDNRKPADDKGANFLYYLEKLVGGVEVFNPYQKAYIQAFEGKSLTTQQWEEHFWCVPPQTM